jgi:hypothetical protein
MAIVIECVGVAGVGKSQFAHDLVHALDRGGLRAVDAMAPIAPARARSRRRARKLGYATIEAVRSPRATTAMIAAIARSRQRDRAYNLSLVLNWLSLRHLAWRAKRADGVYVFDQGVLVGLWSTSLRGDPRPCRDVLRAEGWSWVLPDVVVRVTAPPAQARQQLRERDVAQSRVELLDDAQLSSALDDADLVLQDIVKWWSGRMWAPVHQVENPGDEQLRNRAEELARELELLQTVRTASSDGTEQCLVG